MNIKNAKNILKNISKSILRRANLALVLLLFLDTGTLWLVNSDNMLEASYKPKNMVQISGYPMRKEVRDAFLKMQEDMKKAGIKAPILQSAYRPQKYQQILFDEKYRSLISQGRSEREARRLAAHAVAPPGASEHQTGLAIDLSTNGELSVHFGATHTGIWIRNNCHRYGFIIRYPSDKTGITKIIYEPWHLRYVGLPHSAYMREQGLCLEEYIEHLKRNRLLIYWIDEGSYYRISYREEIFEKYTSDGTISSIYAGEGEGKGYIITELRKF